MLKSIDVFGLQLQTFGIFFALNFLCWAAVAARRLKELGKPVDWAYEMLFVALIGGLIGARGYFLLQNWDDVKGDVFGSLFSGGGLIWYGGLIGGVIAMLIWAKWRGFLSLHLVDIAAIGLPLGYAIGRIGCQISGDGDYGKESSLPWAMGYPHGAVPTDPGVEVQPTPIYETLSMGLLAFVLWNLRDRFRPGVLFGFYLVGAGIERFLVEFARRNDLVVGFMTAAQVESLIMFALGVAWLLFMRARGGGQLVASDAPAPQPKDAKRRRPATA
ncbi:prolipoprotein diacylglyceryl transferase [Conexibacter sp. CPCC 206217]|uniref:prolipoprotein diacylglyceryl transferase n=1 Tax=Conexibacter sp. CPCC 206217 TaxID=3064574 RepID=UPI00271A8B41|nr:prolipoprotein diacylglyceryl transferase [Conexibacter sp. CPCC 206217]MDO8209244.1 prolipoprotein diacylglyceryl transferase [Conexibacter sp. CPCC 206217]